jgi:uncharacterized membrane protein SirB2
MLVTVLPSAMFANQSLTVELVLLVGYITLGSFALKRAPTRRAKLACYVAALVLFGLVVGIARAHHPLGWLLGWVSAR